MLTRVFPVNARRIGEISALENGDDILDRFEAALNLDAPDGQYVNEAARRIRETAIPVAFPTETVYGLGADATRSAAVQGIYAAKQRPSDNPLIVHFASLDQIRSLLTSSLTKQSSGDAKVDIEDPIPEIYHPLISRFWPGPLTILLPSGSQTLLAPEVTAGLSTFGARIPRHPIALALIKAAGVPIAAPSANASTKPSPTAAEHVAHDLSGRIEVILDGGPCEVGVESTVVDGLSTPPLVLRPGGISLERIRRCPGWEATEVGYKNGSELESQPRAPGMKYRHYSPRAPVILYDAESPPPSEAQLQKFLRSALRIGLIRTGTWSLDPRSRLMKQCASASAAIHTPIRPVACPAGFAGMLTEIRDDQRFSTEATVHSVLTQGHAFDLVDIGLGPDISSVARGVFSALRTLDQHDVDAIIVEGIADDGGEISAAIMNRLRKAAEVHVTSDQ